MNQSSKLLFILNPQSGTPKPDWKQVIEDHFKDSKHSVEIYTLPKNCTIGLIENKIKSISPEKVIAVGGDGTVKIVAEAALKLSIPLGILPAGSANGMAKELNIPDNPKAATDLIANGVVKKIDVVIINGEFCIHLADIGFNAFLVKTFESGPVRGMRGYLIAAWKVFWKNPVMKIKIRSEGNYVEREARMIVIANASKYGTGAVINPQGKLDDGLFEVVILKKITPSEIVKMMITHKEYDSRRIEIFSTASVTVQSKHKAHFQVDGEYLGKTHKIEAVIMPASLQVIVPAE